MLSLEEIKKQYPNDIHKFERSLLREYLQYLILEIIFNSNISPKISFLGGTCLRIVHGIKRFSEDLDFDNKELSSKEFQSLAKTIQIELIKQGFEVETTTTKQKAIHCHIKFSNILFENNLSNIKSEKIDIQVDTFDQGYEYESEIYVLNKFNVFKQIRITPKSIILSQKLWTITQRTRVKGRDFYDIIYLLQNTQPDYNFLKLKLSVDSNEKVNEKLLKFIDKVDLKKAMLDVKPFLINSQESEKILMFKEYVKQVLLK